MRHHLSTLAQMYDEPSDLKGFLVVASIIFLAVFLFAYAISRDLRGLLNARKRKIDSRPGFPVDIPPNNPPEKSP